MSQRWRSRLVYLCGACFWCLVYFSACRQQQGLYVIKIRPGSMAFIIFYDAAVSYGSLFPPLNKKGNCDFLSSDFRIARYKVTFASYKVRIAGYKLAITRNIVRMARYKLTNANYKVRIAKKKSELQYSHNCKI